MSTREDYPAGVPCWIDTSQPDPAGAARFYSGLFGWQAEDVMPPGPGRVEARSADGTVVTAVIDQVGGFTIVRPNPPGTFRLYCHATNGTGVLTNWLML